MTSNPGRGYVQIPLLAPSQSRADGLSAPNFQQWSTRGCSGRHQRQLGTTAKTVSIPIQLRRDVQYEAREGGPGDQASGAMMDGYSRDGPTTRQPARAGLAEAGGEASRGRRGDAAQDGGPMRFETGACKQPGPREGKGEKEDEERRYDAGRFETGRGSARQSCGRRVVGADEGAWERNEAGRGSGME